MVSVHGSFDGFDALDLADAVHDGIQALGVLHVEADASLEDAVVAVDVHLADVDVEVVADDLGQIEQDAHPVDAADFGRHQVGHRLVLRPLDFLLDDVVAELTGQPVQLVAGRLVDDDVAAGRVAVAHDLVARNGLAALGDAELWFGLHVGRRLYLTRRHGSIALLGLLLLGDEEGPELEYLALRVDLEGLLQRVDGDDSRADFAVELLLVAAAVGRDDFAQHAAAELDVELLHLVVEHLHAVLDVVLPLALEEALDGLLGLGRRDDVEPLRLGSGVVGRDDFNLVTAVERRGDGLQLVVDFGADSVVADFRVDVVGKVERRGAEGQLT